MALLKSSAGGRPRSATARCCAAWVLGIALLAASGPRSYAQATISAENQVKAVFLFNFAQFLGWPPQAFKGTQAPIVIGVLGTDPFGPYLDGLVQGEKIGDRPMLVRRFRRIEDVTDCQILFVSRSEAGALPRIMAQLKGRSVLTVGDMEGFTRQGGMVRFTTEEGRIHLRINVQSAESAGLTISSRLLAHAAIVSPGED
jgi:hypothetical protein